MGLCLIALPSSCCPLLARGCLCTPTGIVQASLGSRGNSTPPGAPRTAAVSRNERQPHRCKLAEAQSGSERARERGWLGGWARNEDLLSVGMGLPVPGGL